MCPSVHRLRTPCTGHGGRRHRWPCSDSPAIISFSNATRSNSSLKCLIRYSGGLSSIAGMSPVIVYVPRAVLSMRFWAVVDDGPDLEFVGHFTGLANSLGQSVRV